MDKQLHFFALVGPSADKCEVRHIPLMRDVQGKLSEMFHTHAMGLMEPSLERVDFDGRYRVDATEIFTIDDFPVPDNLAMASGDPTSIEVLRLDTSEALKVRAVFGVHVDRHGTLYAVFQEFRQSRLLLSAGNLTLLFRGNTFSRLQEDAFTLSNHADAVLQNGTLYFRSYYAVNRFLDLTAYFREATDKEIAEVCDHPRLIVDDLEGLVEMTDGTVRRKFGIIRQTGILDVISPGKLQKAASVCDLEITVGRKDGKAAVALPSTKRELKDVLTFLCEGIFPGILTKTIYMTNSQRPLRKAVQTAAARKTAKGKENKKNRGKRRK